MTELFHRLDSRVRRIARRLGECFPLDPIARGRDRRLRSEFLEFHWRYSAAIGIRVQNGTVPSGRALWVSSGFPAGIKIELALQKGTEMAGFSSHALTSRSPWLCRYYRLGNQTVHCWEEYLGHQDSPEAESILAEVHTLEQLLALRYQGVRVGRCAASTIVRYHRLKTIDFASDECRKLLLDGLVTSMRYAEASARIIEELSPDVVFFPDRGYTPHGEIFDFCVTHGITTITWNAAHKNNALILRRCDRSNRDEHPASLAPETWDRVRAMPWTDHHRDRLHEELFDAYSKGEWYGEVGTQFGKHLHDPDSIRKNLGLDPRKKTAVIFPHILWDGTFFWGTDLFGSYERWLVETVRAACANDHVNWILKVHPANLVKNARENRWEEPAELEVIRAQIGRLPPHIFVIRPESATSTYSLFRIMDHCLTVRGTIGIEAAVFGIPVLTAGTGRYDRRGFTIDSDTPRRYLDRLSRIQEIPRLSPSEQELAERFAYGVFVLRPLPLTSFTLAYRQDERATPEIRFFARTREDWLRAPDLNALARWINEPGAPDFLAEPLP